MSHIIDLRKKQSMWRESVGIFVGLCAFAVLVVIGLAATTPHCESNYHSGVIVCE